MGLRVWGAALGAAFAVVFALAAAGEGNEIPLKDGVKARFLTAFESTASGGRELVTNFSLSDASVLANHARALDVADELFGRVVLVPADTKGFKRATVDILISEKKAKGGADQKFEDFVYLRGANGVWLRQAGTAPWKTAQDPKFTPPRSEAVQLSRGTVYVDFFGQIYAPPGSAKAVGIEIRSTTPTANIPGKYGEIKEIWARLNREKLKEEGVDFVHIDNFSEPLRGRFQIRQRVYVDIRRPEGGDWPELPMTAPLEGNKEPLVAGVGSSFEDAATRYASAAVGSIVAVSNRSEEAGAVTTAIGISSRGVAVKGPSAFDYLKPPQ